MNQDIPTTDNHLNGYVFTSPPKKPRMKLWLMVAAGTAVLLTLLAVVFVSVRKSATPVSQSSGENSLTLYYRDGKTVLWDSKDKQAGWLNGNEPGFVGTAINELKAKVGHDKLHHGAWRVTTSLDPSLQAAANQNMQDATPQLKRQNAKNAALIAEDITNGQIVAWVSGLDSSSGDAGMITQKIEVGTLALPLTYAAYMENSPSLNVNTTLRDAQEPLPGYPCTNQSLTGAGGNCVRNFDHKFAGQLSLRQALATLRIVPAVSALVQFGGGQSGETTKLQDFAEGLANNGTFVCDTGTSSETRGVESEVPCYSAATFGDGLFATPKDMIQAYATLANGGKKLEQTSVLKAEVNGKTKYEWRQQPGKQAMKAESASTLTDILTDPSASYMREKERFTVNGTKVGIMIGIEGGFTMGSVVQFSSKYAVGVWAAGSPQGISGFTETAVLPPASNWMKAAH